ncbi:unnamed protein product, partial [Effrenium voratum]
MIARAAFLLAALCASLLQAAVGDCVGGSCEAAAAGRVLLQRKQEAKTVVQQEEAQQHRRNRRVRRVDPGHTAAAAAWVATPFSDCVQCPAGSLQIRSVHCLRIFDGAAVAETLCAAYPKPAATKSCDCAELPCNANLTQMCVAPQGGGDEDLDVDFLDLGCYERVAGHAAPAPQAPPSAYDFSCMSYTGAVPCKSGVPFYSMRSNSMNPPMCYEFCTGKGLDIFALVDDVECRCGASAVNQNARAHQVDSQHLDFNLAALTLKQSDMGMCPLRVYRYAGHYEEGGVPYAQTQLLEEDETYLKSIFSGHLVTHLEDAAEGTKTVPPTPEPSLAQGEQTPEGYTRNCWPDNCGPGRGPWEDRVSATPAGVWERYHEYV